MSAVAVPAWLRVPNPIAFYSPEAILFIPQRLLKCVNGQPHLLDHTDRPYLLHQCEQPQLSHLNGCALFVSENGWIFSVYKAGDLYVVDSGTRKVAWMVPAAAPVDEGLAAVQQLAMFFDGSIATNDDGSIYSEEI